MARTVRNQKIGSRTARAALPPKKSGYWTAMAAGCSLGYRKGAKGGVWLAKFVRGEFRREITIGPADDAMDADAMSAIDYADAQRRAGTWFTKKAREAEGHSEITTPLTVDMALNDYIADYRRRGGKAEKEMTTRIDAFIRPNLGSILVEKLTTKRLRDWHAELALTPARLRTSAKATERRTRELDTSDAEALRPRRATVNRTLTILKAALNHAYREGKVSSDHEWRRVQPFREADSAKIRYLTPAEAKRIVNATDAAFRPLVICALLTGCRYGEIIALRVNDFDSDAKTLTIRTAKSGKPRHVALGNDGVEFLQQQTAGKPGDRLIFTRKDGDTWGKSHQHRPLRDACEAAKIKPAASFHILRHTYASLLVMNGAPLQVVAANLGHADTRMTEKHYAHLGKSYISDAIRSALPKLGLVEPTNVVQKTNAALPLSVP